MSRVTPERFRAWLSSRLATPKHGNHLENGWSPEDDMLDARRRLLEVRGLTASLGAIDIVLKCVDSPNRTQCFVFPAAGVHSATLRKHEGIPADFAGEVLDLLRSDPRVVEGRAWRTYLMSSDTVDIEVVSSEEPLTQ